MMKNCYSIVVKFSILEREKIGRDEFSRKLLEEEKKQKWAENKNKNKNKEKKKKEKEMIESSKWARVKNGGWNGNK